MLLDCERHLVFIRGHGRALRQLGGAGGVGYLEEEDGEEEEKEEEEEDVYGYTCPYVCILRSLLS